MATKITDHMLKNTSIRTLLQRVAAESGLNLVGGTFEEGAIVTASNDVVWFRSEGTYYSWGGILPKVVSAGSTPATAGGVGDLLWLDRTDLMLRNSLSSINGAYLVSNAAFYIEDIKNADVTNMPNKAAVIARTRNGNVAGGGIFYFTTSTALTADNGVIFTPLTGTGRLIRQGFSATGGNKFNGAIKAEWYGAIGDGATDDSAAINAALSSFSGVTVELGAYTYYTGTTQITIPPLATLKGTSYGAGIGSASVILTALSTSIAVNLYGGAGSYPTSLLNVFITRPSGTVVPWTVNVKTNSSDHILIRDVCSGRCGIAFNPAGQLDIVFDHCNSFQCVNDHVLISRGAYEVTFINCRFGRNGGTDLDCTNYVRIQGNSDTCNFIRCQFNQSGKNVANFLMFDAYSSPNGIINFSECHLEAVNFGVCSQNDTAVVQRLTFTSCSLHLESATNHFICTGARVLQELRITGCVSIAAAITLDQATYFGIVNNRILGAVLINQGSGTFSNNFCNTNLTFQGSFSHFTALGNQVLGTLTNTASGIISIANNV